MWRCKEIIINELFKNNEVILCGDFNDLITSKFVRVVQDLLPYLIKPGNYVGKRCKGYAREVDFVFSSIPLLNCIIGQVFSGLSDHTPLIG